MKEVKVTKRIPSQQLEASVTYDFPETTAEYVEAFGEDVAVGLLEDQLVLRIQAKLGTELVNSKGVATEKTPEQIQEDIDGWKPGVAAARTGSGKKKVVDNLAKLIAAGKMDEVQELLKAAKAQAEAEAAK
jgi:hypothetical protein